VETTHQIFDISKFKIHCSNCNLAELCLPWGLEINELEEFEKIIKHLRPLQKGEYLFHAGDKFQQLHAVRSGAGAVKAYKTTEDGNEQILGFYLPGELLGLDAIDNMEHICTTVALETSSFCAIPFSRLEELCHKIPNLQRQMYRLMSRELSAENESLLLLSKKSAEGKMTTFIINLSVRLHNLGYSAVEFRLPMSRQEIGNYLGLTVETVSRIFNRLQRDEVISIDRKLIKINDLAGLRRMCAGRKDNGDDTTAITD